MQLTQTHIDYWHKNLRLTAVLLAIWFVATFVLAWYAKELNAFSLCDALLHSPGVVVEVGDGHAHCGPFR